MGDIAVWKATSVSGETCAFGVESLARIWAKNGGSVERLEFWTPAKRPAATDKAMGGMGVEPNRLLERWARPPTPAGWSDTDWIKRLQEQEEPHPLAGLHINQGSMDAAADAYEAEYNAARMLEALKAAAQFVETEQFPIGWSVDRIREVIAKVSGMTPNAALEARGAAASRSKSLLDEEGD